ncbi:Zn-dependent hydrolase [Ureibacillus chungkukjangi]|uniref:Zn-dependent hydrolase n=1 Tax=Ureibacillus chungkukjangi TaxID=1202712 RepID=UPI00203AD6FA|nr:Zn-dependent hydrolase [Ureibacillus chungkukjangi]MCM3390366.1 Zn-dependent hydrolase [Ureibacillus chungkukjangi]
MYKCNEARLKESIVAFSRFGATEKGGVTRLSLSPEDLEARNFFIKCCKELGMEIRLDDMANIYATLPGKSSLPPIVMGSHLDTVVKGGKFDGVLGVLTALEAVRTIRENDIELDVPLTIVNFTNEEGARFEPSMMSSGVLSGKFDKAKMLKSIDKEYVSFEEALKNSGYEGSEENRLTEASAYIELHIEQGPVLEAENIQIGVVEGVLGMVCYEIRLFGESNHAGTTPMKLRRDPLFLANNCITMLLGELGKVDEELVYTIGRMNVTPNIHTVIPDKVVFTIEARHKDSEIITKVEEIIHALPQLEGGCKIEKEKLWDRDTVVFDQEICNQIEKASNGYGYSSKRLYSGAGHDAQFIASYIPSAMIFVPSINGKSHCEEEETTFEDCVKGADVLLETVLNLQTKVAMKEALI